VSRNVEIKARLRDPDETRRRVEAIADSGPEVLDQHDTFFRVPEGRLKVRRFGPGRGTLIAYRREDAPGPTTSHYVLAETADPDGLRDALGTMLGIVGEVRKRRSVYLVGRTRIHLDTVDGLGDFLELEVVLVPGEARSVGEAEADGLTARLGIAPEDLVDVAYVDLVAADVTPDRSEERESP